jgi:hypothetical protein
MQYSTSESTQGRSATPALLSFRSGVWYRARLRIGGDEASQLTQLKSNGILTCIARSPSNGAR